MPIIPSLYFKPISDDAFVLIDDCVMRCAYATQNKFGRLFEERIYENDLAARLRSEGFDVHTQVPVVVKHGGFEKTYYLDLVVNHMLYELKVAANLTNDHEAQALHYAMLQNIRLVKLVNFGETKVRGKLICNALCNADRYHSSMRDSDMLCVTWHCGRLVAYLRSLLDDWGTHLYSNLYNEAIVNHFGGETHCIKRIELLSGVLVLGTHRVQLHAEGNAFVVTSLVRDQDAYHRHLDVLLSHTKLKCIQWINLNHSEVEINTVMAKE